MPQYDTVTTLRNRIDSLQAEVSRLAGDDSREKETERLNAALDAAPIRESPIMAGVQMQIEQQRQAAQSWLDRCNVPADADGNLKAVVLAMRGIDDSARQLFAGLVVAIAGGEPVDGPGLPAIVERWPQLKPEVQSALATLAGRYAHISTTVAAQDRF